MSSASNPFREIGVVIIRAAYDCAQKSECMLKADEKAEKEARVLLFYEYVYFFMHMTMRSAFSQMNARQLKRLQEYLGPLISSTAVDSFFGHWPEELKAKMKTEFYDNLNNAEIEYSASKDLLSKENPFTGDSLLSKLGRNVAELLDGSRNPATLMLVIVSAQECLQRMNLDSLIQGARKVP